MENHADSASMTTDVELVRRLFELLRPVLDERTTRLLVAALATVLGRGGSRVVTEATGVRSKRIWQGKRDLEELRDASAVTPPREGRIRRPGGGRKRLVDKDPALLHDLGTLVEPTKSLRHLAEELKAKGHTVSPSTVGQLLHGLGYRRRAPSTRHDADGERPRPHPAGLQRQDVLARPVEQLTAEPVRKAELVPRGERVPAPVAGPVVDGHVPVLHGLPVHAERRGAEPRIEGGRAGVSDADLERKGGGLVVTDRRGAREADVERQPRSRPTRGRRGRTGARGHEQQAEAEGAPRRGDERPDGP
jgi:hypothetical protein